MVSFLEGYRETFMDFLVMHLGFQNSMVIKNLIIFFSGAAFAFLLATFIGVRVLMVIKRDKRAEGASLVRINTDKSEKGYVLFAYPKTFMDYLQTYGTYIGWLSRGKKPHICFRDSRRGKFILYLTVILCVITFIIGLWFALEFYPSEPI